jgi:hypothetical protein
MENPLLYMFGLVITAIFSGSASAWFLVRRQADKLKAEAEKIVAEATATEATATKVLIEASNTLVTSLTARLIILENKVGSQELIIRSQYKGLADSEAKIGSQGRRIEILEADRVLLIKGVRQLCAQPRKLGSEPIWEPEENSITLPERG